MWERGFSGGPILDIASSLQFLHASHVSEREIRLSWGVWNGLLGHATGGVEDGDRNIARNARRTGGTGCRHEHRRKHASDTDQV